MHTTHEVATNFANVFEIIITTCLSNVRMHGAETGMRPYHVLNYLARHETNVAQF